MENFIIDFFRMENGECPVSDFLDSLDKKMRAKILRLLQLLENNGNELREPYSKPIGDGIFELRAKQGTDIIRVMYFFVIGHRIILTNGFVKKTQKTPTNEVELAKKYRRIYLGREERTHE